MSQAQRVLDRLKSGPLTATEALHELSCGRLAARVKDLREQGIDITTTIKTVVNRHGEECRIGVYRLVRK